MKGKLLKVLAVLGCLALGAGVVACGGDGNEGNGGVSSSSEEITSSVVVDSSSEDVSSDIVDESSSEDVSSDVVENSSVIDSSSDDSSVEDSVSSEDSSSEEDSDEEEVIVGTEGLVYTLNAAGDEYSVTGYEGTATEVQIPSIYEGLPVTSIGDYAFLELTNLTNIEIPNSVTSVGLGSFAYCSSLTSVAIPDSVMSIGEGTFVGCDSLTSVAIGESLMSIGKGAFFSCNSLTEILVSGNNDNYQSIDGNLYSKSGDTLIYYVTGKTATSFAIPDCVTSIGELAFFYNGNLTEIEIPNSVTHISEGAFYACYSLTKVVLPDSVTSIGVGAFGECIGLLEVVISPTVTTIENSAFSDCENLTEIVIPDSVTSMGSSVFDNCTNLTIYCAAESKPSGWDSGWNSSDRPVVWGYNGEENEDDGKDDEDVVDPNALTETRPVVFSIEPLDGNFNPFFVTSATDLEVLSMTQISMLGVDANGNVVCGQDQPTVVDSYTISTDDSGNFTDYSFVIKNGIQFSDGMPLTIEDVLFNLYVYLDPAYKGPTTIYSVDIVGLAAYWAQDADMVAADYALEPISGITTSKTADGKNDVLNIRINGVDPKAIWEFDFIVAPKHYYSSEEAIESTNFGVKFNNSDFFNNVLKTPEKDGLPIGAGPYKATDKYGSDEPNKNSFYVNNFVYFKRNDYFKTVGSELCNAKIKYLRYKMVNSDQIVQAMHMGEIDVGKPDATAANLEAISQAGLKYKTLPTNGYGYVGINPTFVPDLEVRQAIMYAMDIYYTLVYYTEDLAYPVYRSMSRESWAYPKGEAGEYPYYDPALAYRGFILELVGKAGWQLGSDGKLYKEGKALEIAFTIAGGTTDHPAYNMFLAAEELLEECGFTITVKCNASASKKLVTGGLAVWATEWTSGVDPDMYARYHKDSKATFTKNWGYDVILNDQTGEYLEEQIIIDELSLLIEEARETTVQSERAEIYAQALDKVMELAVELPTYQRNDCVAYTSLIDAKSLNNNPTAFAGVMDRIWELDYID